jgi:catechol 2,3-dioxygenase
MRVRALGHAAINVRSLADSERFYHDILGMPIAARTDLLGGMTFFSLGNHHDFAIHEVGEDAQGATTGDILSRPGLSHLAFKVGDTLEELQAVKAHLERHNVPIVLTADHEVTASLYVLDPDGNGVELYVDTSDVWQRSPEQVATMRPLAV